MARAWQPHRGVQESGEHVRPGETDGGVSHEVKNLLNPLSLQLEILRRRIDRGELEAALSLIAEMRQVIRHGIELAERLRALAANPHDG